MTREGIEFGFDGQHAEAEAQAYAEFLAQEFPTGASRSPTMAPCKGSGTRDAALILAIVALAIALPSALTDGLEVSQSLELKAKFERLIVWAKDHRARGLKNPLVALHPRGTSMPLDQAKPEQLLDAVIANAPKLPQKS